MSHLPQPKSSQITTKQHRVYRPFGFAPVRAYDLISNGPRFKQPGRVRGTPGARYSSKALRSRLYPGVGRAKWLGSPCRSPSHQRRSSLYRASACISPVASFAVNTAAGSHADLSGWIATPRIISAQHSSGSSRASPLEAQFYLGRRRPGPRGHAGASRRRCRVPLLQLSHSARSASLRSVTSLPISLAAPLV